MPQTIAIDFDGVIHRYSKGWHDGTIYDEPVQGAFDALEALRGEYAVVIFTTRDVYQVGDWLGDHGFTKITTVWTPPFWNNTEYILITNTKPAAIVYIDDRAIRFINWVQAITDFKSLETQ